MPINIPGVMTEIDIWRAAYLMLWWYGETAQKEGARRADEFCTARSAKHAGSGSSMQLGSSGTRHRRGCCIDNLPGFGQNYCLCLHNFRHCGNVGAGRV